jgi:1-deoxy-D-xylulose-5-phosphate synthase
VIIRYPKAICPAGDPAFSLPLIEGRGVWVSRPSVEQDDGFRVHESERSRGMCLMFAGGLYPQVTAAARILESRGIEADLYNLRFLKPVDEDYLSAVLNQYDNVILIEEGSRSGGFGEYLAELVIRRHCSCLLKTLGCKEKFDALGEREELLARNGLDAEGIANAVSSVICTEELLPNHRTGAQGRI